MKGWLHDCELKHDRCKPPVGQMPKRLIDVGRLGGAPPRVVMSRDLQKQYTPPIRYTTLSYCWGNSNFCTTKENETSHKQELYYELLPQTLQDAITVTRQLDIPYIWIDALCIMQDDHAEWEVESSQMRDVYSGSSLTIAASDAADGSMGCFPPSFDDDGSLNIPGIFLTISNNGDEEEFFVRVQPQDTRTLAEEVVLNTRGWVLQEMVLSNRIVHCMKSGLYWECRSTCRTETGVQFDRSTVKNKSVAILPHDAQKGTNKTWWNWMESYSRRHFTFPRDRLPALAGIVRYYQAATKDIPILGLWESSFHQDLLWMRVEKLIDGVEPSPNYISNVPSWTWLSCPHEVWLDFPMDRAKDKLYGIQDHIKLVEWAVDWTSEPLTSGIKPTRLI